MSKISIYSKTGAKSESTVTLDASVFGATANHDLLDLAYRSYLANGRLSSAKTLTRGEVRGGGRKPWRQKGTGRARFGSIRVPNWRGGGTVFGATGDENYTISMPKTMKRTAIRQALSTQLDAKKVSVIDKFEAAGKVKPTVELFSKMNLSGRILLVVAEKDLAVDRSTRNVSGLKVSQAMYLNVFEVLNADHIVITKDSLAIISEWLGSDAKDGEK